MSHNRTGHKDSKRVPSKGMTAHQSRQEQKARIGDREQTESEIATLKLDLLSIRMDDSPLGREYPNRGND